MVIRRFGWFYLIVTVLLTASCANTPSYYGKPVTPVNQCQIGPGYMRSERINIRRIVNVNMVAFNQPFWYNRLGASQTDGMIYALASDIIYIGTDAAGPALLKQLQKGDTADYSKLVDYVSMRPDKRPRPIVLRANVNDCLSIHFTNLLVPKAKELTSYAGVHIEGTEVIATSANDPGAIGNDGAFIGLNSINLAKPGESKDYAIFVPAEGAFVLYSAADNHSNFFEGQQTFGLFGALNVQPKGAEYYRSQVTRKDLQAATTGHAATGQPLINYQAIDGNGKPILNMLKNLGRGVFELVYTDPTAIITGPNAGTFRTRSGEGPGPQYPNPLEPYREFNIMYHEPVRSQQALWQFDEGARGKGRPSPIATTLAAGGDFFAINYGMAGIGPEIFANRLGIGPMDDCTTCAYEEFFLSSWVVGDPAMVVDTPANFCVNQNRNTIPTSVPVDNPPFCVPGGVNGGQKATKAFYPDDPSNVYHSYMSDHLKMRIHHGAGTLHHLHHLHAHQWLHSPESDNGHYLDSQLIGPGASFTLDMVYNGSGNRNQTVGDSIFHCHFYPHFAEGMWSMWRVHDVFEAGTKLDAYGIPAKGSRALPDGEIVAGTPIPAIVPMPTIAMAPMPLDVFIEDGQVVFGTPMNPIVPNPVTTKNPGYPFFIPGIAGERVPHPPMDFAVLDDGEVLDGGLPRHVVYPFNMPGKEYDPKIVEYHNRFDFTKHYEKLEGKLLMEGGTLIEQVAMRTHSQRLHASFTPEGNRAPFVLNGLPPQQGAPYADPCSYFSAGQNLKTPIPIGPEHTRYYRVVDMQMDVILNKKGWHYSQQRFGVLWEDLIPTLNKERPPEPLFFRSNSTECIEYWLANVIPEYYELDDFQVRTPTDVLGQHIHLVKFDVTSSDGSANGFNYEDGTFAPEAVTGRIKAFNNGKLDNHTGKLTAVAPIWLCANLSASNKKDCKDRAEYEWMGTQATVQRWYADPQLNNMGQDRTLRTVFTHDHFSPSTHQQAGLYMGLLVEPEGSTWKDSETGVPFYTRDDGGPTSWQAVITMPYEADSYREFALEFQDFQLAYTGDSLRPQLCPKEYYPENWPPMCYPEINEHTDYGHEDEINKLCLKSIGSNGSNPLCGQNPNLSLTPGQYVTGLRGFTNGYSGYLDPVYVINPPQGQGGQVITPTLISTTPPFALGTYSVNYRNEPLPFRVWDPSGNTQVSGVQGDLAHVYTSITRVDPLLDTQDPKYPNGDSYPPLTAGIYAADPFTPLLRAYQGDKVQVRTLVGAHINMHNFSMQGLRWLFEPSNQRSGYRSNQPMGISEHFEMLFTIPPSTVSNSSLADSGVPTNRNDCEYPYRARDEVTFADYLYNPSSEENGLLNGNWGLLRAYQQGRQDLCLEPLPANNLQHIPDVKDTCPADAPQRVYNVVAVTAFQLPDKKVIYNDRERIYDTQALLYFGCDATADASCSAQTLLADLPAQSADNHIEPFVLRAAAGECITLNLTNAFNVSSSGSFPGAEPFNDPQEQNALLQFRYQSTTDTGDNCIKVISNLYFCDMNIAPSKEVAMAPQLVSYDINQANGINLGFNNVQTTKVNATNTFQWYAGISSVDAGGNKRFQPAEFGAANLLTADPVGQINYGMLAGMVIEPEGSCWSSQDGTNTTCQNPPMQGTITNSSHSSITGAQVTVHLTDGDYFQEFVVMTQDSLQFSRFTNTINYGVERMAGKDTGLGTVNGIEQGRGRYRDTVATNLVQNNVGTPKKYQIDMACSFANALGKPYPNQPEGTALGEPETPIFRANPGDPVRFRVMQPHGADQHTFELFGHVWQEEPYNHNSTVITNNPDSQWQGSRMGLSAADRFDIVIASAGGSFKAPGDYLYRSFPGGDQGYGMWGIFRVGDPAGSTYPTERPLVCVPQWNNENPQDLQYIYSHKRFDGYELPAGCSQSSSQRANSTVQCS